MWSSTSHSSASTSQSSLWFLFQYLFASSLLWLFHRGCLCPLFLWQCWQQTRWQGNTLLWECDNSLTESSLEETTSEDTKQWNTSSQLLLCPSRAIEQTHHQISQQMWMYRILYCILITWCLSQLFKNSVQLLKCRDRLKIRNVLQVKSRPKRLFYRIVKIPAQRDPSLKHSALNIGHWTLNIEQIPDVRRPQHSTVLELAFLSSFVSGQGGQRHAGRLDSRQAQLTYLRIFARDLFRQSRHCWTNLRTSSFAMSIAFSSNETLDNEFFLLALFHFSAVSGWTACFFSIVRESFYSVQQNGR